MKLWQPVIPKWIFLFIEKKRIEKNSSYTSMRVFWNGEIKKVKHKQKSPHSIYNLLWFKTQFRHLCCYVYGHHPHRHPQTLPLSGARTLQKTVEKKRKIKTLGNYTAGTFSSTYQQQQKPDAESKQKPSSKAVFFVVVQILLTLKTASFLPLSHSENRY